MKHIVKEPEPQELLAFKAAANDNWKPGYDNLTRETKNALKASLMREQGWICCYCGSRLGNHDSHIEHLRPRSKPEFAASELDYNNLLCSCQDQMKPKEPRHCGAAKGDWYEEDLMISPLDPNCEERFLFTGDGDVHPRADDQAASETIRRLRLDIDKLKAMRSAVITSLIDLGQADIETYLRRDRSGMFPPFLITIRQVLGG